jgi:hypothetical protein
MVFGMTKRVGAGLFLALAVAFLIVNRGAYKGYFQDDEIDNISWTSLLSPADYLKEALSPRFAVTNFRPVGHFYFREAQHFFQLDFPKYVAIVQALHLLNVWLVWLLARKLGAPPLAAAAGCVFFTFHMALFDAVWKPMYVFDVLCATFCLASILLYAHARWILSFIAFWLAYKAKELAIMLPVVLACYELWFGRRRWKPLVPFFLVSLSFGVQGLLFNPNRDNDYTFRFTAAALARTSVYYAGRIFLLPYLGFLLPAAALMAPNRRTCFGLALMGLFLAPLFFLPGRMFSAYCYLPFTGLAIAFAGLCEASRPMVVAVFFLLWLPADYAALRAQRRATLAQDDAVREWVTTLAEYAGAGQRVQAVVYSGAPQGFARWGVEGAIKYLFRGSDPEIHAVDEPGAKQAFQRDNVALLTWEDTAQKLDIASHTPQSRDASYVQIGKATPVWQLDEGWYARERDYRWIAPAAAAHVWRPEGARQFALRVNIGPDLLEKVGPVTVAVALGDVALEPRRFTSKGWQEARWDIAPEPAGEVRIAFQVSPGYRSPEESRELGVAIGGFGFVPR